MSAAQGFFAEVGPPPSPPQSNQHWGTPRVFLDAVEQRFGKIALDLAAKEDNHVAPVWFGPGSPVERENALVSVWDDWVDDRALRWLNPPFEDIGPWAARCSSIRWRCPIAMLTPASIGTEWFRQCVHRSALVLALSPRMTFVGADDPYPKDLMLSVFGPFVAPGFDCWRWR